MAPFRRFVMTSLSVITSSCHLTAERFSVSSGVVSTMLAMLFLLAGRLRHIFTIPLAFWLLIISVQWGSRAYCILTIVTLGKSVLRILPVYAVILSDSKHAFTRASSANFCCLLPSHFAGVFYWH